MGPCESPRRLQQRNRGNSSLSQISNFRIIDTLFLLRYHIIVLYYGVSENEGWQRNGSGHEPSITVQPI